MNNLEMFASANGFRWFPPLEWVLFRNLGDLHTEAIRITRAQVALRGGTPPLWLFCLPDQLQVVGMDWAAPAKCIRHSPGSVGFYG